MPQCDSYGEIRENVPKYANKPRMGRFSSNYKKFNSTLQQLGGGNSQRAARVAVAGWGKYIDVVSTYHGHSPNVSQAIDIMRASGCQGPNLQEFWDMAYFFQAYHKEFNIDYIIFRDRIWNLDGGDRERSRFVRTDNNNNGHCTNTHCDHIHISFYGGDTHNSGLKRPIPPHLLDKRKPKTISVNFNWDDQGGKNSTSDKNSPKYEWKPRNLTKQGSLSNAQYIWAIIRSWGYTEEAAAGIMGNLRQEAGEKLDPKQKQLGGGVGRGLAQWSAGARWETLVNYCKKHKLNEWSIEGQMEFMRNELEGGFRSVHKAIKGNTDVSDVTTIFCRKYEIAGIEAMSQRIDYAKDYFNKFKGSKFHLEKEATDGSSGGTVEEKTEDVVVSVLPTGIYTVSALAPVNLGSVAFLPPEPGEDDGGDSALTDLDL